MALDTFVVRLVLEASAAIDQKSKTDGYKEAVESLSRAFNLAEKADASVAVDSSLFENAQETALSQAVASLELTDDMVANLDKLFALSPVINDFFDNTMVMVEDEKIKNNRLSLLASLVAKAKKVAVFNLLNTK
ncbi:glycyl-tRNA synthetase subunit beta [Chlamydia trachomatis]|nr:glycyl-tRNA synthetase subunit beta [Chlamydia trachomatis]